MKVIFLKRKALKRGAIAVLSAAVLAVLLKVFGVY